MLDVTSRPRTEWWVGSCRPATAEGSDCVVAFDGVLHNRSELREHLADPAAWTAADADLILQSYLRWGEEALSRLTGVFAVGVWDARTETLVCARDPLGMQPLFYAVAGRDTVLSTSIDGLIRHPRVSKEINRAAFVEHFTRRWQTLDETCYAAVRRVPPGHIMRVTGGRRHVYRYWNPAPPGRPVDWITDDELEQFDDLLERAVARCLELGPASINLSGGIDSVAVAVAAADLSRRNDTPLPGAQSLVFPGEASEEVIQRRVASDLGMSQVVTSMADAVGPSGLLWSAMELSAERSIPLLNLWYPAYRHLALQAKDRGSQVILTGTGGDEWLDISPHYAADLIGRLDFVGLYGLWKSWHSSFPISGRMAARNVIWKFGARPLMLAAAHDALRLVAPGTLRSLQRKRLASDLPEWLAPDPALRAELSRRREHGRHLPGRDGFYVRDLRRSLDHPANAFELEDHFENGLRAGVRLLHPFWDPEVVEFLFRTPPRLLYKGGRSKGFVRASLARRFPDLGFEHQQKNIALDYFYSTLITEGKAAWQRIGGAPALAKLGVVDSEMLTADMEDLFSGRRRTQSHLIRDVLLTESWLRPRLEGHGKGV